MTSSNVYMLKKYKSYYDDMCFKKKSQNICHRFFGGCLDGRLIWFDIYQTLFKSKKLNCFKELYSSNY